MRNAVVTVAGSTRCGHGSPRTEWEASGRQAVSLIDIR